MVASSNNIKFWSAAPPRTLKPEDPSPAFVTPGNNRIDFITSASPKTTGTCFIVFEDSALTLIWGFLILVLSTFLVITTSSKLSIASNNWKFKILSSKRSMLSSNCLKPRKLISIL